MKTPQIMSIINITPNSFSGDGVYMNEKKVLAEIKENIEYGADIIDIGAESTAPHNSKISEKEEWERLKNIIPEIFSYISLYNKKLEKKIDTKNNSIKISLDSYKIETWKKFLQSAEENNFDINNIIINDVSGLSKNNNNNNSDICENICENKINIIKKYSQKYLGFQVCVMFDKNKTSETLTPENIISEIITFFTKIIQKFTENSIHSKHLIIDTGMGGFLSSNAEVSFSVMKNLQIIRNFADKNKSIDILIGTSRKTFLAPKKNPKARVQESISSSMQCMKNGANIIRIHDTKELVLEIEKEYMCK